MKKSKHMQKPKHIEKPKYIQPKEEDIIKWCQALRSGEYIQTKSTLQDNKGYCCLGVACVLFIPERKLKTTGISYRHGFLVGILPDDQPQSPQWVLDVNHAFAKKTKYALSNLNDEKDFSFDEIADLLEAVFVHKVLD